MSRKVTWGLVMLLVIGIVTGCNQGGNSSSEKTTSASLEKSQSSLATAISASNTEAGTKETVYPLTITDKFGKNITLEKQPQRVVSFSPELVEIIFALDSGDQLIGRSQYCNYPEGALEIETMGDLFNLNVETLVASNPDLVLLSSMASEEAVTTLQNKGLTVLALDEDTNVDGTYGYIESVGEILNQNLAAENLIQEMQQKVSQIEKQVAGLDKPTVYFVVSAGEYDSTATGDTFIGQLIAMAGGDNIAADGQNWQYSLETLLEKDPQIILCSANYGMKAILENTAGYKDLTAVKEGRVYEVDEDLFYRQGPRLPEALQTLADIFHPGLG